MPDSQGRGTGCLLFMILPPPPLLLLLLLLSCEKCQVISDEGNLCRLGVWVRRQVSGMLFGLVNFELRAFIRRG